MVVPNADGKDIATRDTGGSVADPSHPDVDSTSCEAVLVRAARRKLTPIGEQLKTFLDPLLLPIVDEHWGVASILLTAALGLVIVAAGIILDAFFPAGSAGTSLQGLYDCLRPIASCSPLFPFAVGGAVYFLACSAFTLVDVWRPTWVQRLMIQPRAAADFGGPELGLLRTIRQQACCFACSAPPVSLLFLSGAQVMYRRPWVEPCLWACDFQLPKEAPSLVEFLVHFGFCLLTNDFGYWYWHWMCHRHRALYKHIHQLHHEYRAPFALEGAHVHPLEFLAVYLFAFIPPMACGAHPLTTWVWIATATLMGVEDHSGYRSSPFGAFMTLATLGAWGGAPHHDVHHQSPWCNYQPFLGYLDKLAGTGMPIEAKLVDGSKKVTAAMGTYTEKGKPQGVVCEEKARTSAGGLRRREATPPRGGQPPAT